MPRRDERLQRREGLGEAARQEERRGLVVRLCDGRGAARARREEVRREGVRTWASPSWRSGSPAAGYEGPRVVMVMVCFAAAVLGLEVAGGFCEDGGSYVREEEPDEGELGNGDEVRGSDLSECVELAGAPLTCTGSGEGGSDGVRWEHVLAFRVPKSTRDFGPWLSLASKSAWEVIWGNRALLLIGHYLAGLGWYSASGTPGSPCLAGARDGLPKLRTG